MQNSTNMRILELLRFLYERTDENHPATVSDIIAHLNGKGIQAVRQTVYADTNALIDAGIDIVVVKSTQNQYFMGSRLFEYPELKMLTDAVASSKIISAKKSEELVQKLCRLTSLHQAKQLQKFAALSSRVKPHNEKVYYIIDNTGYKMARDGKWIVWMGMWTSSAVLAPLGVFLTYKSNKDSVVLNADAYINWFKKIMGIRSVRHIFKKEVIIHDPDYPRLTGDLEQLTAECRAYAAKKRLEKAPNYFKLWMSSEDDNEVMAINEKLEALVEEMSNTKSATLIGALNNYPVISVSAHVRPFHIYWLNLVAGVIFPIGLFFYFRIWAFRVRLAKDMERIIKNNEQIQFIIQKINK